MLPLSLCRLWQPDRAANAAQDTRSYTTARGTIRSRALIHSGCGAGVKCNDGGAASPTRGSVLRVFARAACAGEALAAVDRSLRRTRRAAAGIGAILQRDGSAIDRPGAADSHADRRLLLWHPL